MKKILIVYTSVGMGHKLVGQSISMALRRHSRLRIRELDLIKQNESAFNKGFERVYIYVITKAQWIWAAIYKSKLFNKITLPLRVPYARFNSKKFEHYLQSVKPDLIVTTHTAASAIVSAMKRTGKFKGPLVISFSDWHFHPYWFYKEANRILVQTNEQMESLISLGYPREKIVVTGLPVNEAYTTRHNEGQIYRQFNLSRTKPVITIMGGSRGWGVKENDLKELLKIKYDVQFVVLVGTDQKLREKLVELVGRYNTPVRVFGFLPNEEVAKLFYISKVLVTKPGGSTIGEALATKLPMVLINPLPAMEELNQKFLVSRGAAVRADSPEQARLWVERLLQDKKLCRDIQKQMSLINPEKAATLAAEAIIDML